MNKQHQRKYIFATLCKTNNQQQFGENSLQKLNEFLNTGGVYILLILTNPTITISILIKLIYVFV